MSISLQQYFPMIRTKEDIISEISGNRKLSGRFYSWTTEQREEFLEFCTGEKGVKVLYDSFLKEILSFEKTPERLEDLLSLVLKKNVRAVYSFPSDSASVADENTPLITDIAVEFEDASIASVELQKGGYKFSGERSACISADMLLRQYRYVRNAGQRYFSYEDIKTVYTIVLFERSPESFQAFPDSYIHYFEQHSDTGLELELLQKYIFISLDIFKKNCHNKPIESRLEAWLVFFSEEGPERIKELINGYPEFKFMYEDIYRICCNMEKIMKIFSEELKILDRNAVQMMIDELQDDLGVQKQQNTLMKDRVVRLEKINFLSRVLAENDRTDDIIKAAEDEAYCNRLLSEFHI